MTEPNDSNEIDVLDSTSKKEIDVLDSTSKKEIDVLDSTSKKEIDVLDSTSKEEIDGRDSTSKKEIGGLESTSNAALIPSERPNSPDSDVGMKSVGSNAQLNEPLNGDKIAVNANAVFDVEESTLAFDNILASPREIYSWICYHFANECYSTVSIGVIIPLLLDSLAFNGGFDPVNGGPCIAANTTAGTPQYCEINFGTSSLDTTSFSLYTIAISVGIQAFVFISFSSLADFSGWRKIFLLGWAFSGALFTILFITTGSDMYAWACALTVLSNICFGAATIFHNAYLPFLVESHPLLSEFKKTEDAKRDDAVAEKAIHIGNSISTYGFATGYVGGVIVLAIAAAVILIIGTNSVFSLQLGIMISGIWWASFTIFPMIFLKPRPGPPLPSENWFLLSWKRLFRSFSRFKQFPSTFIYLFSYFFFSDGYNTIASVAVLFGRRDLGLSNTQLIIVALLVPIFAGFGNYILLFFQRVTKIHTKWMVIFCLIMIALLMAYGMVGFAPGAKFGIVSVTELYIAGCYYGFFLGAVQSFSRVTFIQLIPPGHESEFFGLYGITEKGSSWIGSAVTAAITNANGNVRFGMVFIFFLVIVPVPIIATINMQKARDRAQHVSYDI